MRTPLPNLDASSNADLRPTSDPSRNEGCFPLANGPESNAKDRTTIPATGLNSSHSIDAREKEFPLPKNDEENRAESQFGNHAALTIPVATRRYQDRTKDDAPHQRPFFIDRFHFRRADFFVAETKLKSRDRIRLIVLDAEKIMAAVVLQHLQQRSLEEDRVAGQ